MYVCVYIYIYIDKWFGGGGLGQLSTGRRRTCAATCTGAPSTGWEVPLMGETNIFSF